MPTTTEILAGLTRISNEWIGVAIAWHAALAAAVLAYVLGWRPRPQRAALLITALPASVAVFAVIGGNPFNAIVFGVLSLALAFVAMRVAATPSARSPAWIAWAGVLALAYAWTYPHFLIGDPVRYLYAAPVGLVPCPTLAAAIGLALLLHAYAARVWSLTLAAAAALYAMFGVARLGVLLDVGLLIAAGLLAAATFASRSTQVVHASARVTQPVRV